MSRLSESLARISADLDDLGVRWAVVGGLAVSVRAEPRMTRDVDVAISVASDTDAERIVRALRDRGYEPVALLEQEGAHRLATARMTAEGQPEGIVIDLLFASSGIESEIVDSSDRLEVFAGIEARVASVSHLMAMKILARDDRTRPQDLDDLRSLLARASGTDIETTRALLLLITERGFARRRNLVESFELLLREERG
ncbi:MAG TPA: nucleotidyl transferase AbiEii/AbiGii toxin family protein [Thermoanaerobaculia bacterium]|jgi:predicted nucleotidyltransferase|nr:nucleotidyl transferase AbiEii/AbiGii toxin family protein [Thermoanaerobaculia bacterium]